MYNIQTYSNFKLHKTMHVRDGDGRVFGQMTRNHTRRSNRTVKLEETIVPLES